MARTINKWKHTPPYDRLTDWIKIYGKPHIYSPAAGGLAIWYPLEDPKLTKRLSPFTEIMIRDESIQHHNPRSHCDFLYGSVRVHIPVEQRADILSLSDSINYDPLKLSLTARCHFLRPTLVTLLLSLHIQQGNLNIISARQLYGPFIMALTPKSVSPGRLNNQAKTFLREYIGGTNVSDDKLISELDRAVKNNKDQFFEQHTLLNTDCNQAHTETQ